MRHERDGGVETSLEVVSGVDVGAEQDFEACVVEWENRVGLWDQLVGETLASSGDGFLPEVVGQDGALEGWEVEFASVHRRMLLVASVESCDEVDADLASSGSTASCPGDRAKTFGETLVGDSGASAEATRPEFAGQLVQGLSRLQSAWAIRRWWSSVGNARKAREARGQGEARVRGAGLVKMVKMAARWQSSWVLQEWQQAVMAGKRGRSLVAVVAWERGTTVLSGVRVWRGRVREARQMVDGEAGRLVQVAGKMFDRCMSLARSGGHVANEPHPRTFYELKYETPEFPNIGILNTAAISAAARRRKAATRRGEYAGLNKTIPEDTSRRSNGPRKTDRRNYPDSVRPSMISLEVNGPQEYDLNVS